MSRGKRLVLTRVFEASPERVFAAWTSPELLKRWFGPDPGMTVPTADVDLREGGCYRLVVKDSDGDIYSPSGVYETIVPNEKLVFSWKWADSELITRVTVELRDLGVDQTELTLTHEGFPETEIRDRHIQGWQGCLAKLKDVF